MLGAAGQGAGVARGSVSAEHLVSAPEHSHGAALTPGT